MIVFYPGSSPDAMKKFRLRTHQERGKIFAGENFYFAKTFLNTKETKMSKIIVCLVFTLMIAGSIVASADFIGTDDKTVVAIADPILDNILAGFKEISYEKYSRDFDATLKKAVSAEKFLKTQKQIAAYYGEYQSRQYLGFLNQGTSTEVLWKSRFVNTTDDVLMQLTVSKKDDKYLVSGLWFK
jgi:hypothetical protein